MGSIRAFVVQLDKSGNFKHCQALTYCAGYQAAKGYYFPDGSSQWHITATTGEVARSSAKREWMYQRELAKNAANRFR